MANKVFLIGNLTREPELKETNTGIAVCNFSIAVNRDYKDSNGNTPTDFFNIIVWRNRGETCARYLKKGNKVAVIGALQNRTYEDENGIKRHITDIIASDVEFLTPKNALGNEENRKTIAELDDVVEDDKLPF